MAKLLVGRRLKNLVLFIPNLVLLCGRLLTDSRVPTAERALVGAAILYAIVPFDLIPDMIPFVGQIDDVYLISLTLLRLIDRTDPNIVREHWRGGGDVVDFIDSAAKVAAKFLPQRIRRVLTSRVEVAPGKLEELKSKPFLVARPELEAVPVNEQRVSGE
jgi:uncharacterized membrane protein YkvA (DUF1232 family)